MAISEKLVNAGFEYAKEVYAAKGVDVEAAMAKAADTTISLHCWQGDDVNGCEGDSASPPPAITPARPATPTSCARIWTS